MQHITSLQDALTRKKDNDELRVIRLKELMRRLGLSRSSIYALIQKGLLKRPIALGARSVGWLEQDLQDFLVARIKESRSGSKGAAA